MIKLKLLLEASTPAIKIVKYATASPGSGPTKLKGFYKLSAPGSGRGAFVYKTHDSIDNSTYWTVDFRDFRNDSGWSKTKYDSKTKEEAFKHAKSWINGTLKDHP